MAKLSKSNTYAILWLNSQNKDVEEIVNELSLTEKQVSSVLKKINTPIAENNIKTAKSSASTTNNRSMNLMIRETAAKKNNSVCIMTGEASMTNDELKSKTPPENQKQKTDSYIFRPKND